MAKRLVTRIDPMPKITRAIMAVAFVGALSFPGVTTAAFAASQYEGRITQESCESLGGTYSFYRGVRSCTKTIDMTRTSPPQGISTTPQDGTYYRASYHRVSQRLATTTWSQRGNHVSFPTSENTTNVWYIPRTCSRVENYLTPNQFETAVDTAECEQHNVYPTPIRSKFG